MANNEDLPEAHSDQAPPDLPSLQPGPPFAISLDCDLLDGKQAGSQGAFATVRCECGQGFRVNLLASGYKSCPKCHAEFTHILLIAHSDDHDIITEAMATVLAANGYQVPDDDGRETNPDDDGDDGEGEGEGELGDDGDDGDDGEGEEEGE